MACSFPSSRSRKTFSGRRWRRRSPGSCRRDDGSARSRRVGEDAFAVEFEQPGEIAEARGRHETRERVRARRYGRDEQPRLEAAGAAAEEGTQLEEGSI